MRKNIHSDSSFQLFCNKTVIEKESLLALDTKHIVVSATKQVSLMPKAHRKINALHIISVKERMQIIIQILYCPLIICKSKGELQKNINFFIRSLTITLSKHTVFIRGG